MMSLVAPLTAAALIAQQVAANAIRDALFLTWFPVTSLPFFVGASALLAIPAVEAAGRLLARYGPGRVVPTVLAISGVLFITEWLLLGGQPRVAAVLLYVHSSVLGAIAISTFWSLLNERFDPHAAKPLMARVAAAAAFGGLAGGVGAERIAAMMPQGALLLVLGLGGAVCMTGAVVLGRASPAGQRSREDVAGGVSGWTEIRRVPLLRDLALVVTLAAVLAALVDYVLKAEAVAYFGKGEPLVRFFGLFYAGTGLAAFFLQATTGPFLLARLGLGGAVATHAAAVGAASLLGLVVPGPWRGIIPRGLDVAVRGSVFRAGYELFYTPLSNATKRAAKSIIDVAADSFGKGAGAVVILMLTGLIPRFGLTAVSVASVLISGMELVVARRLRSGYVNALEGGLKRQSEDLDRAAQYSLSDFTVVQSMGGLDRASVLRALGETAAPTGPARLDDAVVAAIVELRSGDLNRIRAVLRAPPRDQLLVGALIPLLAQKEVLRPVVAALTAFGSGVAGQLVDGLLDPATPDIVRRRLPLVLKSCASSLARDGLMQAMSATSLEVRLRCGRALLALTERHPDLVVNGQLALSAVEIELSNDGDHDSVHEHVFNLLGLALEREPVRITALAFQTDDAYLRGTALEYLETVLPARIFSALSPRLAMKGTPAPRRGDPAAARAHLLDVAATMRITRDQVERQLAAELDEG
jgi:hypothetical protein